MSRSATTITATTALAVAALGGAFLLGTAVTQDDPGKPRAKEHRALAAGTPLGDSDVALVAAGSCDDLLGWYVENTRDLVTAYGWGGGGVVYDVRQRDGWVGGPTFAGDGAFVELQNGRAPMASADRVTRSYAELSKSPLDGQGNSETGTNVQELGVDETDVVKTDGETLLRLVGDDLVVYDVTGKQPERLATLDLPGKQQGQPEMLLVDDRVVVFSAGWDGDRATTTALTVSLADPEEPEVVGSTTYDAELVSARQYGTTVRLVLSRGLPSLDFVMPGEDRSEREALEENRKVLEESAITDWLPTASDDEEDPELAVDCGDMARPDDFDGGGNLVVLGYDAADPAERESTGVASSAMTLYSSSDRLYLATQAANPVCCWDDVVINREGPWGAPDRIVPPMPMPEQDGTTTLHAFSLEGSSATYLASGEVEGAVRDRWAMDAVDGTLRVALSPTSETGDFNSVVTLGEEDGALVELGRVDRIGVGEEITSVRWFDDVAFVVTFRQVDPLYAIDLSDVEEPTLAGELKIPGFSEYLHPIGGDLLLGIGVPGDRWGAGAGVQASVFDISDLAHLKRVDAIRYRPNKHSDVGADPRQFTWVPELRTAIHVVGRYGRSGGMTGFLGVLTIDERGQIEKQVRFGTHGYDDVAALRTVPLPGERVVVVTEDEARFLDLTP